MPHSHNIDYYIGHVKEESLAEALADFEDPLEGGPVDLLSSLEVDEDYVDDELTIDFDEFLYHFIKKLKRNDRSLKAPVVSFLPDEPERAGLTERVSYLEKGLDQELLKKNDCQKDNKGRKIYSHLRYGKMTPHKAE